MKKCLLIFGILLFGSFHLFSQSSNYPSFLFQCNELTTDLSADMKHYLISNYEGKIFDYILDIEQHSVRIATNMQPVDILQLFRMKGYEAIYVGEKHRYTLVADGSRLRAIKE